MVGDIYTEADYFRSRFPYDRSKHRIWAEIGSYLDQEYGIDGTVVDVGAGYGYFLSAVSARRKLAVDVSAYPLSRVDEPIDTCLGNATDLPLADDTADVVMASNVLEHLEVEEIRRALTEFRRVLGKDGTLFVITPNFALAPGKYFDDFTHRTILTHRSAADLLAVSGFEVKETVVRFLPFSAEGRVPAFRPLVRLYLALPISPFAGQSLLVAEPKHD
ncbi:type 11 methyltransferase [Halobacterium sp. DL1]|jgi:ubiquinone/menaquinone biosynthesis C-methylase UbiE|nr:type 11 methyltransferase [Halobacterium sp. DL1]